jgi:hypothetical protein
MAGPVPTPIPSTFPLPAKSPALMDAFTLGLFAGVKAASATLRDLATYSAFAALSGPEVLNIAADAMDKQIAERGAK